MFTYALCSKPSLKYIAVCRFELARKSSLNQRDICYMTSFVRLKLVNSPNLLSRKTKNRNFTSSFPRCFHFAGPRDNYCQRMPIGVTDLRKEKTIFSITESSKRNNLNRRFEGDEKPHKMKL